MPLLEKNLALRNNEELLKLMTIYRGIEVTFAHIVLYFGVDSLAKGIRQQ